MLKIFLIILLLEGLHSAGCMKKESPYCKEQGYIGQTRQVEETGERPPEGIEGRGIPPSDFDAGSEGLH